ncbi:MAG: DUF502 domain-containing protein [bacterium]|jgi:uncharacterized membrane protein
MKHTLRVLAGNFLSGLVTLLPLVITVFLVGWIYGKAAQLFGRTSSLGQALSTLADSLNLPTNLTIALAYLLIILLIILVGAFASRTARNTVAEWIKNLVVRFPVISSIYNSAEQIVGIFNKRKDDPAAASQVILFRFANSLLLGLLPSSDPIHIDGRPYFMVYYPATPVPMSGQNFLIPASEVYATGLKFEDMTKVLVSIGAIAPEILGDDMKLRPVLDAA